MVALWLENDIKTGVVHVIGFHDDLESVPEGERPPYVELSEMPVIPEGKYVYGYDFDAKALVFKDLEPTPESEIEKLKATNEALKNQLAELNQTQSDFMDYIFTAVQGLPQ